MAQFAYLARNIREARRAAGLSQSELGEKIGVSGVAIMRYEKGQREPKLDQLEKIASALGTTPAQLMGWGERPNELNLDLMSRSLAEAIGKDEQEIADWLHDTLPSNVSKFGEFFEKAYSIYSNSETEKGQIARISLAFDKLNVEGRFRAVERVEELTEIPKYQRKEPENAEEVPNTPLEGNDHPG